MKRTLKHSEVIEMTNAISDAKVLNLDASLKSLMQPAATAMKHIGDEVAIHVLCCNEYGLITGATADLDIAEVRNELQSLRATVEQMSKGGG
ncbi:MAG TPA: hypothetical protein VKP30_30360 [Polyangiaceae bacterium]|nr:hypothetical protein [Polyangiaceae bacterium]